MYIYTYIYITHACRLKQSTSTRSVHATDNHLQHVHICMYAEEASTLPQLSSPD